MAVRELSSPPSMRTLYPKAVAGAGRSALRKLPGLGGADRQLPDTQLVLSGFDVDREHLAAYDRVCGFRLRDELPPTYPHVVAFPLAMELMTDTSFPFPVVGLVHIANRVETVRPMSASERLSVRVWAGDLGEHERGMQFQVHAEASVQGEAVWRSSSRYLHRSGGGGGGGERSADETGRAGGAVWEVPGDIGRRYAAVSGDRNPIHLHPLGAKLFGMKGHIAHGMWTKARCLAALEGELPESYTAEVRFKLPLYLPARVAFSTWVEGDVRHFSVRDADSGK